MYPNSIDLPELEANAHRVPLHDGLVMDSALQLRPLTALETDLELEVAQTFAELSAPRGIRAMQRKQSLPALEDGEYEVNIGPQSFTVFGDEFIVPDTKVVVNHSRALHQSVVFDPTQYVEGESEYWELSQNEAGLVEKITNLQGATRDFSLVYSDFVIDLEKPQGYEEAVAGFAKFHEEVLVPHREALVASYKEFAKDGKIDEAIAHIKEKDKEVLAEHKEVLQRFIRAIAAPCVQRNAALGRLYKEYRELTTARPLVFRYQGTSLVVDDSQRVIEVAAIGHERKLRRPDLLRNTFSRMGLPYNSRFQEELRSRLQKERPEFKPYEALAYGKLHDAYQALLDGHVDAAILSAASGFESMVRGFLYDKAVITPEEEKGMHALLGYCFDKAVRGDGTKRRRNLFDPHIKERILGIDDTKKGVREIRNLTAHGITRYEDQPTWRAALVTLDTYAEGIDYIMCKGWKRMRRPDLNSEALTALYPALNGSVPPITRKATDDSMQRGLTRLISYLSPFQLKAMKKRVPKDSWAYDTLQKS